MTTKSLEERTILVGLTELAWEMHQENQKMQAFHNAEFVLTGFFGGGDSNG